MFIMMDEDYNNKNKKVLKWMRYYLLYFQLYHQSLLRLYRMTCNAALQVLSSGVTKTFCRPPSEFSICMQMMKKGTYALDVERNGDEYEYVLKNKQNNKENKFDFESEIQSYIRISNSFNIQNKVNGIQDKMVFNDAVEKITSLY